jgi:TetR/AcrR family transcriptional regulator, cholesterol catabolism regulator
VSVRNETVNSEIGSEANPVIEVGGGVLYATGPVEEPVIKQPLTPQRIDIPATRRQQIFEAATRIITEKGFERATMREIAREAGLTIPTMYQYLKSKDGILELIFDTYLTKIESALRSAVDGKVTATERLTAAVSSTLASLTEHHREIRIMTRDTASLRPAIREIVLQRMVKYLSVFTGVVKSGVESGEFRPIDVELYANLIPMMCQVWAQRYWSVGKFGLDAVESAILDFTFNGIRDRRGPP